jgi:hypothetical protein
MLALGLDSWFLNICKVALKFQRAFKADEVDHRFRVDGGKPPGIRLKGNARRCRILLNHTSSTILDLRLFSQVEVCIDPRAA